MKLPKLTTHKTAKLLIYAATILLSLAVLLLSYIAPKIAVTIKVDDVRSCMGGFAFCVTVPEVSWPYEAPSDSSGLSSQLQLFENGLPLGPPHALHAQIMAKGGGAYSHWQSYVVFSTHDNSDPRHNGNRYSLTDRAMVRPGVWIFPLILLPLLFAFLLTDFAAYLKRLALLPLPPTAFPRSNPLHWLGFEVRTASALAVALAICGFGALTAQSLGVLRLDPLGEALSLTECVLAGVLSGLAVFAALWERRTGKPALSHFTFVLLPASLLLLWVGGLLHYVNSPSQRYLRGTQIGVSALYPADEFVRIFGQPDASTYRSGESLGIAAPWWVARLRDGDTIILRDPQLDLTHLRRETEERPTFIELFGHEHTTSGPGRLTMGEASAPISSAWGAVWTRIPLQARDIPANGEFSVTYHAAYSADYFELWGTLADSNSWTHPARPRLVDHKGIELTLVFGPAPIRGGRVTEANVRQVAQLGDAPNVDAIWRFGWKTGYPNTKRLSLFIVSLGVLGIATFVLLRLRALPSRRSQVALFLGVGLCASIYFLCACMRNGELVLNNYLSSEQARRLLILKDEQRGQFIREHLHPPSKGYIYFDDPNLMVQRTLGDHGVITDDSGYAMLGWRVFNNDRSRNLTLPLGLPVFISMTAQFFGLSLSWNALMQAVLYAAAGAILGAAALVLGANPMIGLIVWLFWLFDVEAAQFTQITWSEGLTFPFGSILIFIFADSLTCKEDVRNRLTLNTIALAIALSIAIYIRDIFIVLAFPIVGLFLLARWSGLKDAILRGALILMIVAASWIPVAYLFNDRSLSVGLLSLMPMEMDHVQDSNFGSAPESWAGSLPEGSLPLRWMHNSEYFWSRQWVYWSGMPFEGQLFGGLSAVVAEALPYLFVISGLALFLIPTNLALRKFILGSFAFLATVTLFHAVAIPYITGRFRAPYEPLRVILAGFGVLMSVRLIAGILHSLWFRLKNRRKSA